MEELWRNRYQTCDTEPDASAADYGSQQDFFTRTVTSCRIDIKMTPLKGKDGGYVLINLVNNPSPPPCIYLN